MRAHVILAVFRRNLASYFAGILGYLFIVVFVVVGAFLAFSPQFFVDNLANLDQLTESYPLLLLFLIPAITMSSWAEEKKLGTDELLFTLPATDVEILLGKYLSSLAVYSIILGFSLTHLVVLAWIGDPDWGVLFSNYVGYWVAGAALVSAGMFASVLTRSTTVAFVLGTIICGLPVFIGNMRPDSEFLRNLSLSEQLKSFGAGIVPLTGLLYFASLTAFMLYLNLVVISRRHWSADIKARMGTQFAIRAVSLSALLVSMNFICESSGVLVSAKVDMTAGNYYSLSDTTQNVLGNLKEKNRPVTIQAFLSSQVPREYVGIRKQLIGLLRQYDRLGGSFMEIRYVDVKNPHSAQGNEAKSFGIELIKQQTERNGRKIEEDVFMGLVITSSLGEVVIPKIDKNTSVEFEITRSVGLVSSEHKLKLGILETDAQLQLHLKQPEARLAFGRLVAELKKQYDLVSVAPEELKDYLPKPKVKKTKNAKENKENSSKNNSKVKKEKKLDVLLAVAPSSLTRQKLAELVNYIQAGKPVLILADPVPFYPFCYMYPQFGLVDAPRQKCPDVGSPFAFMSTAPQHQAKLPKDFSRYPPQIQQQIMQSRRPTFAEKANGGSPISLLDALGIFWNSGALVWDSSAKPPGFEPLWPEEQGEVWPENFGSQDSAYVFLKKWKENESAFDEEHLTTKGLQQMLMFYPGSFKSVDKAGLRFTPLLTTSKNCGVWQWDQFTKPVMLEVPDRFGGSTRHEEAMHPGTRRKSLVLVKEPPPMKSDGEPRVLAAHIESKNSENKEKINVIFVADSDFVSDYFFEIQNKYNQPLDNLVFLFNAIDHLGGDNQFVKLRSRRPLPRSLNIVEAKTNVFREKRRDAEREAAEEAQKKIGQAQKRLNSESSKIQKSKDLGVFQRAQLLGKAIADQEVLVRMETEKIEKDKKDKIDEIKANEEKLVRNYEDRIRYFAIAIPPIPAIVLGLAILFMRISNERSSLSAKRMR